MNVLLRGTDGRFPSIDKISTAIYKAAEAIGGQQPRGSEELAKQVEDYIEKEEKISTPTVEHISKMWWNVP